jgi:D-lactate dehydrogenase
MNIVFFEVEPWMQAYIEPKLQHHQLTFASEPLTESTVSKYTAAEIISVFVFSKVTADVIRQLPHLKMIAARSTGTDHIDSQATAERNIPVINVPRYGSITVAEHTWALIFALSRRIFESYDRTEVSNFSTTGLRGFDLYGKTLGLIGLGEIGKHVAKMSKGFGLKLRIFNRSKDLEFASQFDNCVFVDQVEDVYSHADIISFHVPLTQDTHHLLNSSNYRTLKQGSIIVNTSRGALIETQSLVKALQENIIRGAGLDVLESEQLMKTELQDSSNLPKEQELAEAYLNHLLIGMDNVIITPHNAFNSDESIKRLADGNIDSISNYTQSQATVSQ